MRLNELFEALIEEIENFVHDGAPSGWPILTG